MTQPSEAESKLVDKSSKAQIGDQQTAITAPSGGGTIDAEARTAINSIISALEAHGLVADN